MRLASLEKDHWQLRDGERCHAENPENFWIPKLSQRKSLRRGDAAKLIFDIECEDENEELIVQGERILVIVFEVIDHQYLGILDSQPISIKKERDDLYLCFGAEIPFLPKHVIDIDRPPKDYIEWQLGIPPSRKWP